MGDAQPGGSLADSARAGSSSVAASDAEGELLNCLAVDKRPGLVLADWLVKEGGTRLSAAFPSRRFCMLMARKLEYYEQRVVKLRPKKGAATKLGINLNEWNLVVHVKPGHVASGESSGGVLVGDVLTAIDGQGVHSGMLADDLECRADKTCVLTLLRQKGEIPLTAGSVEAIGKRHGGYAFHIQPSPRELLDSTRSAFVFVAPDEAAVIRWCDSVGSCITQADESRKAAGAGRVGAS